MGPAPGKGDSREAMVLSACAGWARPQAGPRVLPPAPLGLMWQLRTAVWVAPPRDSCSLGRYLLSTCCVLSIVVARGGGDQSRPRSLFMGFPF